MQKSSKRILTQSLETAHLPADTQVQITLPLLAVVFGAGAEQCQRFNQAKILTGSWNQPKSVDH